MNPSQRPNRSYSAEQAKCGGCKICWLDAGGTRALCIMTDLSNPQDEADLERRIEQQRLLVARLLNESKSTAEANEALYRLCQAAAM